MSSRVVQDGPAGRAPCPRKTSCARLNAGPQTTKLHGERHPGGHPNNHQPQMQSIVRTTFNSLPRQSTSALPCLCRAPAWAAPSVRFSSTAAAPLAERTKYALPNGLVLKGLVTSTGKMAQTSTVTVERKMTDHKTLKVSKKPFVPELRPSQARDEHGRADVDFRARRSSRSTPST